MSRAREWATRLAATWVVSVAIGAVKAWQRLKA